MSAEEVDEYLRGVEEPKRATLEALRATILEIVPDAEQVISYRVPAFRVGGKTVAGFAAFNDHLSYLPFSGSVLAQLPDELEAYGQVHLPRNGRLLPWGSRHPEQPPWYPARRVSGEEAPWAMLVVGTSGVGAGSGIPLVLVDAEPSAAEE
jgi:uncharacterized protein YdhG (YjbR/CyaY superfamily)